MHTILTGKKGGSPKKAAPKADGDEANS